MTMPGPKSTRKPTSATARKRAVARAQKGSDRSGPPSTMHQVTAPHADPCEAALDLLRTQVIFIKAAMWGGGSWDEAPHYGIDPEFWTPRACANALRMAQQLRSQKGRP